MTTYIGLPLTGSSPYWGNAVASVAGLPVTGQTDNEIVFVVDTKSLYHWDQTGNVWIKFLDGLADVSGPASSTDNAFARFDGATGKIIQNSAVTADDSGNISTAGTFDGRDVSADGATLDAHVAATVAHGATGAVVGTTNSQVLTNKSIDADTNTITNIENADIKAGAAIDATKIADGSVTSIEFQYINTLSSNAQTQLAARVVGPASAVDNTIVRYDSTTGKLVKGSGVTIDASDNVATTARVNAGTAKVGGTGAAATSTVLELTGTVGALLLNRLTTVQRDALTASNGMIIYNTTDDRFQGYFAGAWGPLHGWGS